MKPCVRCLNDQVARKRAGANKEFCILQCDGPESCGFNVTGATFFEAEAQWNGFKVWELIEG